MPPEVDHEKCIGCGQCIEGYSEDVFFGTKGFGKLTGEKPVISNPEMCWHCNWCVKRCPVEGAIRLRIPLSMFVAYK